MKILELFAGTRSIGKAFEARGHEVYSIEWDKRFENIDLYADILNVTAEEIREKFGQPDVIWASPDCFPMGTLVWTDKGYIPIEDITVHTKVYTHRGNYKEVYKKFETVKRDIYAVSICDSTETLVSSEHPFYVKKKDGEEWVKAKDLKVGDKVGIFIEEKARLPRYTGGIREDYDRETNTKITWIEDKYTKLFKNRNFWWLIGAVCSNGGEWHLMSYKYTTENKKKAEKLYSMAVYCGIKVEKRIEKGEYIVYFNDKDLYDFIKEVGNPKLSKMVYELPKKLLNSFLDGWLELGVEEEIEGEKYYKQLCKVTAYMLQLCFARERGQYLVVKRVNNTLNEYMVKLSENKEIKLEDGILWVTLTKAEQLENRYMKLFNLSVKDDESYTADNVIVHNCTTFSMAGISHHRKKNEKTGELEAVSEYAKFCDKVDKHVVELIKELNPKYYFIENPVGGMRKMSWMQDLPRYTTTYCQYGDTRMKPTDIWSNHPNPQFKPPCHRGDKCHEAAPRGSKTGTQGLRNSMERSRIPQALCEHIVDICEGSKL